MDKKYIVYTCITGGYDTLHEIKYLSPNIDYICFTDNLNLKSNTWKIIPLPNDIMLINSKVKQQRLIKILPHKYIPNASDYEASLWVDGNIEIVGDLNDFFLKYDISKKFLYVNKHPSRDCIYREQIAVIRYKKDTFENTNPQINRYRDEGFPEHYGLGETNILLRKHNDKCCIKTMDLWANELKNGSHRDQLSFNYAIWKTQCKDKIDYLCEKYYNIKITDNVFFSLVKHKRDMNYNIISDNNSQNIKINNDKINNSPVILNKEKEYPVVSIVIFTHNRTNVALETLKSLFKNLKYPNLNWIISDDMSTKEHLSEIDGLFKEYGIKYDLCQTEKPKIGLGASMNNGLKHAFEKSDIVLRTEDDWILQKELNLISFVNEIKSNKDVYGIRLGMIGNNVVSEPFENTKYKKIVGKDISSWIFVNQVMLVHKRTYANLGYYLENTSADKAEEEFRNRFNKISDNGKLKYVLFPNEIKWNTYDDESLYFIHIGRSTLGHSNYKEPKRYSWLYDINKIKDITPIKNIININNTFDILHAKKEKYDKKDINNEKEKDVLKNINNKKNIINNNKVFNFPTISVMMTTHNRTALAEFCLENLIKKLKYSGKIHWIICDDRSEIGHTEVLRNKFIENNINDFSILTTNNKSFGLGASMNNGLKNAFKYGDVVLTTEDDWYLKNNYNIDDKVRILLEDNKIAGIRIGALCSELGKDLKEDFKHKDFYKISKNNIKQGRSYIFNNQIMIRHKRIFDKIGYMKENCSASSQENDLITKYNNLTNFGNNEEFKVLFPKNYNVGTLYGEKNPFFHIGVSTNPNVKRFVRKEFIYLNNPDLDKKLREKYMNNDYFFFKVIIPSYNSEKYIKQCIESIEMQTFTNYKIIIVDDVSNDKTRDILLSLQKKYNNINLIFLDKKVYAGGCRNVGVDTNIKSLYTIFIDSDDYLIDKTAFQQIYDCINKNNNPDCVEISYKKESCDKDNIAKSKTSIDILKYRVFAPWRKVIKSSILQKFVPNRIKGNDVVWTFRQVDKTNTIATIDKPLYFYRTSNENSVWNGFNKTNKTIKEENDSIFILLKNDLEKESFKIKEVEEYKKNEINLIMNKKGVYK